MPEINLTLTQPDIDTIIAALGERKAVDVYYLIAKIHAQLNGQMQEEAAEE